MRKQVTKQLNNYWIMQFCFETAFTDKQVSVRVSAYLKCYMSFRPMHIQPMHFQLLSFQTITLSTACNFKRMQFQPILISFKVVAFFANVLKLFKYKFKRIQNFRCTKVCNI